MSHLPMVHSTAPRRHEARSNRHDPPCTWRMVLLVFADGAGGVGGWCCWWCWRMVLLVLADGAAGLRGWCCWGVGGAGVPVAVLVLANGAAGEAGAAATTAAAATWW
jgi:hypothetical protein